MMQKTIFTAAILLVIQIGLVVALNRGNSELAPATSDTSFVRFDPSKVTKVEISGPEKAQITLVKSDDGWVIKDSYTVPAHSEQVNEVLTKLASAKQGLAVTTSADSSGRFKTAADEFERHVIISEGDATVADFYLGTSAGFRHSHVRKAEEAAVYSIPISNYELAFETDGWLDKDLAKIERERVIQIEMGNLTLVKGDESWSLKAPEEAPAHPEEVEKLLDIVTDLTVQDVIDPNEAGPLFKREVDKRFTVTLDDDTERTYSLMKKDDSFILKMSDNDLYFKVMAWQIEDLDTIDPKSLSIKEDQQEKEISTSK